MTRQHFAPSWLKCIVCVACALVFPAIVAGLLVGYGARVQWWVLPGALAVTLYGLAAILQGRPPKPMSVMVDLVRGRAEVRERR